MVTDEALEFLLENVITPHLPEDHPPFKSFFTVVYWDGKKLFEINHKEIFIIVADSNHKEPPRKLRLSVYDDPFVMDEYELFAPGMYAYLSVYRHCFASVKNARTLGKLSGSQKKLDKLINSALKSTQIYYLNRRVKLDTCLQVFVEEGAILGSEIALNQPSKDIERIFQDANAKDFLFFVTQANWQIKRIADIELTGENVDGECSFCQTEIEAWQNHTSPNKLQIEGKEQVKRK